MKISRALSLIGVNPLTGYTAIRNTPRFLKTVLGYTAQSKGSKFPLRLPHINPCLTNLNGEADTLTGHYFYQDLWAARKIYLIRPKRHVDIGSRVDGFVTHLLTFMPVELIDIRPLDIQVSGLTFTCGDATALKTYADNALESLSALHVAEHFGLGRYGDPVDPDAWIKFMRELARVLRRGGRLYFSVPIGKECLYFNAHRVFSPQTALEVFKDLKLISFSAVDDAGRFYIDADPKDFAKARYSCGLYEFTKG